MEDNFKFKVNLRGMIDILSNHLYSSPDVFIREMLQNGVDAISARAQSDTEFKKSDGSIEIEVQDKQTLIFRDNGSGLTADEIHRFLSVIGQSSKYDIENSMSSGDYIGRFGIGLLSCFMVTESICVKTRSFKSPDTTLEWNGFADGTYTINEISESIPIGTQIIIKNNKKDKEDKIDEYFTEAAVENLVFYYGLFLKYPVYLINGDKKERLNHRFKLDPIHNKREYMKAGELLLGEEFLDCFALSSPNGLFEGVAYVIPYPVSASAHNMHRIYLKNMLLTVNGEKLLPDWSFFIRCIINTNNLRPTSSREDFYIDDDLEKAREDIAVCISKYLERLSITDTEMLNKIVRIHSLAVKSVIAETDSLDDILLPYILFETSLGTMSGRDLTSFGGTAYYTTDVNQFKQLSRLYTQRNRLLINAGYVYETQIMMKLADNSEATFINKLTDEDIGFMLDESDLCGDEDAERLCAYMNRILKKYDCSAALKQFEPFDIPALYTVNEKAEENRKIKRSMESADDVFMEMLSAFQQEITDNSKACLYLNTNNMIIRKMTTMSDENKIHCYTEILYVQSLLSGHFPLLNGEMQILNENLCRLMEF